MAMTALYPPEPLTSIGKLRDTEAMSVAREWLATDAWGLLMLGAVGRGKSCAAAWLHGQMKREAFELAQGPGLFDRPRDVLWLRARVLQRLTWQERASVIMQCSKAFGLVVDEMGGEDQKTGEALSDVLEERGDRAERTVMTTNLEPRDFVGRYGDRLVSRLRSGGLNSDGKAKWARVVQGEDLRGEVETR